MNIKVFNIRLAKQFCQDDQSRMNQFLDTVDVKLTSTNFVTTGSIDFWSAVVFYLPKNPTQGKSNNKLIDSQLSTEESKIFNTLKLWRNDLAKILNRPSYTICHNSHLIAVARSNPQTLEDLEGVSGFGKIRAEKYGEDILAVLNAL